jgi:hypothetical protein
MALNIGITICLREENESLWSNGIKQNALFLARMFMNSKKKYNVYIVNTSNVNITNKLGWDIEKYKTVLFTEYKDKLDIIFPLGGALGHANVKYLRDRGCKIVSYNCGNDYVINMENIIFNRQDQALEFPQVDEIWSIPQLMNTNKHYWRIIQNTETVKEVPFVWHHMFLDDHINELKNMGKEPYYTPAKGGKRISVFEPNINVVKFSMYPMLILEQTYRDDPSLIYKAKITNTQKVRESKQYSSLMLHMGIVKKNIATFENRFPVAWFLAEHTDIVLSHQWENPLNYAYLDALYMKYPLVHNAYMIKDVGYYYEGFDVIDGSDKLKYAIKYHDENLEEYDKKSQKTLWKYNADNPEVVQQYDILIENLMNKK